MNMKDENSNILTPMKIIIEEMMTLEYKTVAFEKHKTSQSRDISSGIFGCQLFK